MKNFSGFLSESKVSIKKQKTLRSELFNTKTKKLDPKVRTQLMLIGKTWAKEMDIPSSAIVRYDFVGSSASFLYHEESDIDLHLIIDMDKMSKCEDLLRDYLRKSKAVWESAHEIEIYDIPVEIYAEDKDDPRPRLQARYNLSANEWIQEPDRERIPEINDIEIQTKAELWLDRIDDLIEADTESEVAIKSLKDRVLNLRKVAMSKGEEYQESNLVYKVVRAEGGLDKLDRYMRGIQDKNLSLYK